MRAATTKSFMLVSALVLIGPLTASVGSAEFQPRLSGRVDVVVEQADCIENNVGVCKDPSMFGINNYDSNDTIKQLEPVATAKGRVEVEVFDLRGTTEIGAFSRVEFDASQNSTTEWDAHAFLKDSWGELYVGTDIDADQGAFDRDFHAAGPLSIAGEVTAPKPSHRFDTETLDEATIVYQTPDFIGLTLAAEIDAQRNGMASVRFQTGLFNGNADVSLAAQSNGAVAGKLRLDREAFSAAAYAGLDPDGDGYIGGGLGYTFGALRLTGEGGFIRTEDSQTIGKARELQLLGGASYKILRGVDLSGSVLWFRQDREDPVNQRHSLQGTRAAARLRVAY